MILRKEISALRARLQTHRMEEHTHVRRSGLSRTRPSPRSVFPCSPCPQSRRHLQTGTHRRTYFILPRTHQSLSSASAGYGMEGTYQRSLRTNWHLYPTCVRTPLWTLCTGHARSREVWHVGMSGSDRRTGTWLASSTKVMARDGMSSLDRMRTSRTYDSFSRSWNS